MTILHTHVSFFTVFDTKLLLTVFIVSFLTAFISIIIELIKGSDFEGVVKLAAGKYFSTFFAVGIFYGITIFALLFSVGYLIYNLL